MRDNYFVYTWRCSSSRSKSLSADEAADRLTQLHQPWQLHGAKALRHEFSFDSFMEAMIFVNDIAALAEEYRCHPELRIHGGTVIVELACEQHKNLTDREFELARKIELCC